MSKKKYPAAPAKPKAAKQKATAAPQGAHDAPAKGKATMKPTPAAKTPKAPKPFDVAATELFGNDPDAAAAYGIKLGKGKKAAPASEPTPQPTPAPAAKEAKAPRAESKGATILELIGRADRATLAEIMKATGWQKHSVRGFISTAGKKRTITSSKNEAGERTYHIAN